MKRFVYVLLSFLFLSIPSIDYPSAQEKPLETIVFTGNEIKFNGHPGLVFRISKPFLRYQKWDPQHTGQPSFAIALEVSNQSEQFISAVYFSVLLYDKAGKIIYSGTVGAGPDTFEPKDGNVLRPGYRGVYDAFVTRDKSIYKEYGKLDFKITEVKTAAASLTDKPVFPEKGLTFNGYPGMEFILSKPYVLLDGLSGNEYFAIAMQFKNNVEKDIKFIYFKVRVFDEKGIVDEKEVQQHNGIYVPEPENFRDIYFPRKYAGINKKFYINDKSFVDKFKKIEIELIRVE